jgi:hypothetical protein
MRRLLGRRLLLETKALKRSVQSALEVIELA